MDINEGELVQVKVEEDENIDNDIKTEIVKVKEEPREIPLSVIYDICNENSPNDAGCIHIKNDRLGNSEEDNKLQTSSLHSADTFKKDVKPKLDDTESNSSQKDEDSIMKLINAEVTVKEEEYLDSPEYMSTDMDLVECEIGQVKTEEDDDIFCENIEIESVKEEPTDNEDSLSSDVCTQDEDSNQDLQPGSSKESRKAVANTKSKKCCMVPGCKSSTISTPDKLFLPLPRDKNERQSWQLAMRKTDFVSPKSNHYCCEDHFKLEEDAVNYMQFKMMGNVKLKMKPGIGPSLFACQKESNPPREYSSKRRLPDVVKEARTGAKKSRKSQAKEFRDQATQTEYHRYMRDVGIQVNLMCDDEEPKRTQSKARRAPRKRAKKSK